jgi:hypothetical protein
MGMAVILCGMNYPHKWKIPNQEAFSMEHQWCGKTQISIQPQMFQHLDQYLMKIRHKDQICGQDTALCSKCGAANCKTANKVLVHSKCKGHYSVRSSCAVFYCVLLYEHVKDTNKTKY